MVWHHFHVLFHDWWMLKSSVVCSTRSCTQRCLLVYSHHSSRYVPFISPPLYSCFHRNDLFCGYAKLFAFAHSNQVEKFTFHHVWCVWKHLHKCEDAARLCTARRYLQLECCLWRSVDLDISWTIGTINETAMCYNYNISSPFHKTNPDIFVLYMHHVTMYTIQHCLSTTVPWRIHPSDKNCYTAYRLRDLPTLLSRCTSELGFRERRRKRSYILFLQCFRVSLPVTTTTLPDLKTKLLIHYIERYTVQVVKQCLLNIRRCS